MSSSHTVSTWFLDLKAGDVEGLQELWKRFYEKLVVHAKGRIRRTGVKSLDEEEVACSAFESLWRAAQEGRLATVRDCDELWWWLLSTVHRKVVSHARHQTAIKRGGQNTPASMDDGHFLQAVLSHEPSPEYVAILAEEYDRALAKLNDEQLREIAIMKLAGATNDEVCQKLGIAPATVTRKLRRIQTIWQELSGE
jgi:DNA-directed RNA polymerase specialized sigma24 family protein